MESLTTPTRTFPLFAHRAQKSEDHQFLYETTTDTPVSQLVKDLVDIHNMRLRIQRLKVREPSPRGWGREGDASMTDPGSAHTDVHIYIPLRAFHPFTTRFRGGWGEEDVLSNELFPSFVFENDEKNLSTLGWRWRRRRRHNRTSFFLSSASIFIRPIPLLPHHQMPHHNKTP